MENLGSNPTIVNGDLLELSPMRLPHPILKPSDKDNLIMLQTPVQKNLKVSFLTPKRTPLKDHNRQDAVVNTGPTPTHFTANSLSHATVNTEVVRQTILPTLMKTPNSLKGFKSLISKETPQLSPVEENESCDLKWESLRKLDENQRWRDRAEVITKLDHEEHMKCAQQVVYDMISKAVDVAEDKAREKPSATSESMGILATTVVIQCDKDTNKDNENTLLKPRHDTFDAASPFLDISSSNRPVISPEESLVGKRVPQYNITDSTYSGLQPCKPSVTSNTLKSARSFSDGTNTPFNKSSSESKVRHQSLDLDQIKFDFDPISTCCIEKIHVSQSSKQSPVETLNQSVFSPAMGADAQPEFALRAVDSIFGDGDFVDSAKLVDQGHLDLDYLENKTSGTISKDLQKESLYVRFDPLLEGLGNRQSIALLGRKSDIIDFSGRITPIPEEVNVDTSKPTEREPDLLCDSPPQVRQDDLVPNNNLHPAKQGSSGSGSSGSFAEDHVLEKPSNSGIIEVLKYTDADLQRALQKRRDKWMREKSVLQERNQLQEEKLKHLKLVKQNLSQRCEDESNRLSKEKSEMEEYMAHQRGEQQMVNAKTKELTDKMSVLFRKMESLQNAVANHKSNEKTLKDTIAQMKEKKVSTNEKIRQLEEQTTEKLKEINSEKASVESSFVTQMNKLKMKIRAAELRAESLQTTLNLKQKEKEELLKICDELVASSEGHS